MINYSIIKKSQLEGAYRLDAEYYQPEYLELNQKLQNSNPVFLKNVSKIVYGTTPKGGFFEETGIPFIRSQNFNDFIIDNSDLVFCSEKFNIQNKKSEIKSGDILFAAVGATIGELAVVQDKIKKGNINQNIAKVRINSNEIISPFAGIFFGSKFGQFQIQRLITGNAQPYLNSDQIGALIVPILDIKNQIEIEKYFKKSTNEIENSKSFYFQAESLLLKELELESFEKEVEKEISNVVNFSEIKKFERMDADYFQAKYEKLSAVIRKNNGKKLGELVSLKKGFEPGSEAYEEEGKLFIRVSSLSKDGITDKDQKYLKDELYEKLKKDYQPKVGEILLTKDATPGIAYVLKEELEGIMAGGVLRLKLKEDIEPEYLTLCINSIMGQMQVERDAGGSVIAHWKPEQVKNILIPILPKRIQIKISELVQKSHESRKKAKELLEEAKHKVEELIENN